MTNITRLRDDHFIDAYKCFTAETVIPEDWLCEFETQSCGE